jgi:hypothetical protein
MFVAPGRKQFTGNASQGSTGEALVKEARRRCGLQQVVKLQTKSPQAACCHHGETILIEIDKMISHRSSSSLLCLGFCLLTRPRSIHHDSHVGGTGKAQIGTSDLIASACHLTQGEFMNSCRRAGNGECAGLSFCFWNCQARWSQLLDCSTGLPLPQQTECNVPGWCHGGWNCQSGNDLQRGEHRINRTRAADDKERSLANHALLEDSDGQRGAEMEDFSWWEAAKVKGRQLVAWPIGQEIVSLAQAAGN